MKNPEPVREDLFTSIPALAAPDDSVGWNSATSRWKPWDPRQWRRARSTGRRRPRPAIGRFRLMRKQGPFEPGFRKPLYGHRQAVTRGLARAMPHAGGPHRECASVSQQATRRPRPAPQPKPAHDRDCRDRHRWSRGRRLRLVVHPHWPERSGRRQLRRSSHSRRRKCGGSGLARRHLEREHHPRVDRRRDRLVRRLPGSGAAGRRRWPYRRGPDNEHHRIDDPDRRRREQRSDNGRPDRTDQRQPAARQPAQEHRRSKPAPTRPRPSRRPGRSTWVRCRPTARLSTSTRLGPSRSTASRGRSR